MEIAHIIAQLRKDNRLSQRDLAKAINVSAGVIGSWETGRIQTAFESCIALADYFRISTDVLFDKDRLLKPEEYQQNKLSSESMKILQLFDELDEENKDILIGKAREMLKEQRIEKNMSSKNDIKQAQ